LAVPLLAPAGPAAAADACGIMLMPAVQLKQVSRGFSGGHTGVDLTAPYGTPVRSAIGGRVIFTGRYFGYGNMVDVQHEGGVVTRYAHLSAFGPDIRPGHAVQTGDELGKIGTSGIAHGAHLHFEVRMGSRAVDPKPYLGLASCILRPDSTTEMARAADPAEPDASEGRPGGLFQ
jgi:murein DD-endopeptidase MepM/ murein hydrolase activator NlpD